MSNNPTTDLCRTLIQRLTELEADRARLLRHISHELKTPLAALREGVALLHEEVVGPLNSDQHEVVAILEHNTGVLQRQIEDLLRYHATVFEFARLQKRRVSLRELLTGVVEAQRLQLQASGLRVEIECGAGDQVRLDPDKLRVALGNLLANAILFSPEGSEIRLLAARAGEVGDRLFIECIDQGPGVAAADAERIFDPFVQGRRRPAAGPQGSGVGLAIVREVAAAHGGRVTLLPSAHGAHFRMDLPYEN
jgi:two-component system sensor histidine kinase GlrK